MVLVLSENTQNKKSNKGMHTNDSKILTQYNLALKYYLQRNFNKSFHLIKPLVDDLQIAKLNHSNEDNDNDSHNDYDDKHDLLILKVIKLYFTLLNLLLTEIRNYQLLNLSTHTTTVNFEEYLKNDNQDNEILNKFNNNYMFDLLTDMNLTKYLDLVLMCFIIESNNNLNMNQLIDQAESILRMNNLLPTVRSVDENSKEFQLLEFYIYKIYLAYYGYDKSCILINKIFDNNEKQKWLNSLKKYEDDINSHNNLNNWGVEAEPDNDSDDAIYDYEDDYDLDDINGSADDEDTVVEGGKNKIMNEINSNVVQSRLQPSKSKNNLKSKQKHRIRNKEKIKRTKKDSHRRSSISRELIRPFEYLNNCISNYAGENSITNPFTYIGTVFLVVAMTSIVLLNPQRFRRQAVQLYMRVRQTLELVLRVR